MTTDGKILFRNARWCTPEEISSACSMTMDMMERATKSGSLIDYPNDPLYFAAERNRAKRKSAQRSTNGR